MLELARRNASEAGASNVEFLEGHIEAVPLPDSSVDVVISNCVINLSADKAACSPRRTVCCVPADASASATWSPRISSPTPSELSGAATSAASPARSAVADYRAGLQAAGLTDVSVEFTHAVGDGVHAAIVRAVKPPAR